MSELSFDREQLVNYRMVRAKETLKDAHLLLQQGGSPGSVINRGYYAMFYAALALLTAVSQGAAKHSGVIALFDQLFVKSGHISTDMSKAIHKAFDLRQIGDYRELIELDHEQAQEVVGSAERFIEAAEAYLSSVK